MGGDLQAHGRVEQVLQLLGVLRLGTGGGRCGARTSHVAKWSRRDLHFACNVGWRIEGSLGYIESLGRFLLHKLVLHTVNTFINMIMVGIITCDNGLVVVGGGVVVRQSVFG